MPDTLEPTLLAVSRTCSTTRLITLRAAGALRFTATAPAVAAAAAAVATAARFMTFLTAFLRLVFAAPLRPAAERFAAVELRLALLFFGLLFFGLLFFALFFALFFDPRLAERFFEDDLEDRRELRDFLELLPEEDLFLEAMRYLSLADRMMAVALLDRVDR
jgi:hypothetical protein